MHVYTYSEARQNFASVLEEAKRSGKVLVHRKDGSVFSICPEKDKKSPLDIPGIKANATTGDIVSAIRESRKS